MAITITNDQKLTNEARALVLALSNLADAATLQGDDEKAVRLNLLYFKANARYWRRRRQQQEAGRW